MNEFRPTKEEVDRAKGLAACCIADVITADAHVCGGREYFLTRAQSFSRDAFALSKSIATRSKDPK